MRCGGIRRGMESGCAAIPAAIAAGGVVRGTPAPCRGTGPAQRARDPCPAPRDRARTPGARSSLAGVARRRDQEAAGSASTASRTTASISAVRVGSTTFPPAASAT